MSSASALPINSVSTNFRALFKLFVIPKFFLFFNNLYFFLFTFIKKFFITKFVPSDEASSIIISFHFLNY